MAGKQQVRSWQYRQLRVSTSMMFIPQQIHAGKFTDYLHQVSSEDYD